MLDKETKPYFYIIQHIQSGMRYAGARWAVGCHPDEFLKEIGKKKYRNVETDTFKMFLPGAEPEGYVLNSKDKQWA